MKGHADLHQFVTFGLALIWVGFNKGGGEEVKLPFV